DYVFAGLAFINPLWISFNAYDASILGWSIYPPVMVQVSGVITILLILEASRRAVGLPFVILVFIFGVYPLFANYMPGFLVGKQYSFARTIGYHYLGVESILGLPLRSFLKLIAGFMVFAVAMQIGGGGKFFLDLALAILGRVRGGPAKVAVFASALFGSISGAVVANVATTGAVTIPTMKRIGYPPHYAGAVEACASTGGVLMPPIMGVTAFVMAELLGISYLEVAVAAAVPSLLYDFGLLLQVDFYAAKVGLKGLPREEALPSFWLTIRRGWMLIFSIAVLLFFLAYLWREAWAPWFATVVLLGCAMLRKETRLTREKWGKFAVDTGKILAELTSVMAAVGLIIGSLSITGVGFGVSRGIVSIAGGNMLLTLVLGAIAAMILGVGLTTTACYIILAVILAPGLVKAGFDPLAIHLFVMYWGMVSFITPPVAIGAYAAASMAGAPGLRTGLTAMRLGVVIYFVPFFFVLNPALILHGGWLEIVLTIVQALIGITLIASGLEGYFLGIGRISVVMRVIFFVAGSLLAYPDRMTTVIGFFLALGPILVLGIGKLKVSRSSVQRET
ncbi:MAG: TRAP transporter fused permease subunit, partial [Desulfobacterales bacterium]|nr:TRAP transporter fused permease subunit [Desulfobacterales bacterium]